MATGWQQTPCWLEVQNLYFSGTSVCTTSDTLLNTFITSGLVSRTIGSTAILSLFRTHSKVSIFLSSLRTSESVESLNVRINTRLDIYPFRSLNQFDQLHLRLLPMWTTSGSGVRRRSSGGIVLFSDIFSISSRACLLHSSQSVTTARTATLLHCTDSSRQDSQHLSAGR